MRPLLLRPDTDIRCMSAVALCPTCRKPALEQFRPFCSKRCADVDLHRWLSGRYAVPVKDEEDEDGAPRIAPSDEPH
jgi:hypothetical protein